jgi:hypothetical protein
VCYSYFQSTGAAESRCPGNSRHFLEEDKHDALGTIKPSSVPNKDVKPHLISDIVGDQKAPRYEEVEL